MIVLLKRGRIGKSHGIDVSVKSATGWATALAPTWDMVFGHKGGTMGDVEYKQLYTGILETAGEDVFRKLWEAGIANGGRTTVLCYCQSGHFCHTHLLVDFAVKKYPQWFADGRRTQKPSKGDKMRYLLAVDLETTGLKQNYHEITQIAAILLDKRLDELGSFDTLVRVEFPERGLENNFNVFEYTGIKPEDLRNAPPPKDALRALETFVRSKTGEFDLRGLSIFGQNPTFDKGFLEAAYESQGWKFPFDYHVLGLESMYVHHHLLGTGELPGNIGLRDICRVANVENKQKHNAMSDIRATVDALHKLCPRKGTGLSQNDVGSFVAEGEANKVGKPVAPVPRRRNAKAK